jgi:hypothetical protein
MCYNIYQQWQYQLSFKLKLLIKDGILYCITAFFRLCANCYSCASILLRHYYEWYCHNCPTATYANVIRTNVTDKFLQIWLKMHIFVWVTATYMADIQYVYVYDLMKALFVQIEDTLFPAWQAYCYLRHSNAAIYFLCTYFICEYTMHWN